MKINIQIPENIQLIRNTDYQMLLDFHILYGGYSPYIFIHVKNDQLLLEPLQGVM